MPVASRVDFIDVEREALSPKLLKYSWVRRTLFCNREERVPIFFKQNMNMQPLPTREANVVCVRGCIFVSVVAPRFPRGGRSVCSMGVLGNFQSAVAYR